MFLIILFTYKTNHFLPSVQCIYLYHLQFLVHDTLLNNTNMDMINGFLLFSLLLLCIYFFTKRTSLFTNTKPLPPGPKGLPLLGSLLTVGDRPHESLTKLAQTHGPLMTVKFGLVNVVVVSSSEMAKQILQNNDHAFLGRPTPDAVAAEPNYHMSMVWSSGQGPHWKKLRKICNTQVFTSHRLDKLQDLRHQMMVKMIERVDRAREAREEIHVGRLVFGTTLNLLSNTMFSGDMFDVGSDEMRELRDLIANMMELAGMPNVADYLPFLKPFDPQGIRRGMMVSYDGLHKLFDDIIGRRIKRRAEESARFGDFLDVLLDHTEEDGPDEQLIYLNVKILLMVGLHMYVCFLFVFQFVIYDLFHSLSRIGSTYLHFGFKS